VAVGAAEQNIDQPEHISPLWRSLLPSVVCIFCQIELRMGGKVADGIASVSWMGMFCVVLHIRDSVHGRQKTLFESLIVRFHRSINDGWSLLSTARCISCSGSIKHVGGFSSIRPSQMQSAA
jgi:hypothetical protein